MPPSISGGQRVICNSQFSPSAMGVLGIKPEWSDAAGSPLLMSYPQTVICLPVSLPTQTSCPSVCPHGLALHPSVHLLVWTRCCSFFCIRTQLCGSAPILQPDWSRQPQQPLQPHPGPTAINTDSCVPIHVPSLASQVALKNFQVPWNFNPLWPFCNLHMAVHMDTITV